MRRDEGGEGGFLADLGGGECWGKLGGAWSLLEMCARGPWPWLVLSAWLSWDIVPAVKGH